MTGLVVSVRVPIGSGIRLRNVLGMIWHRLVCRLHVRLLMMIRWWWWWWWTGLLLVLMWIMRIVIICVHGWWICVVVLAVWIIWLHVMLATVAIAMHRRLLLRRRRRLCWIAIVACAIMHRRAIVAHLWRAPVLALIRRWSLHGLI